jgi:hypothetical protein
MWSFGVLFFFMLNMEFPFTMPLQYKNNLDGKYKRLTQMATDFSYKKRIGASRKKIT